MLFARASKIRLHILFKNNFKKLAGDDRGQATVEYVLLLSFTVVFVTTLARALIGVMDKGILQFGGVLEKDLKTGRAPLNVWKN